MCEKVQLCASVWADGNVCTCVSLVRGCVQVVFLGVCERVRALRVGVSTRNSVKRV